MTERIATDPLVEHLPGYALPSTHPLGRREAWQCKVCAGIFYPEVTPTTCPYCAENDGA